MRLLSCVLLLGGGLLVLVPYVRAMATTSLWTDELHTILRYSGRGPLVTVTQYEEPNNHVFFNLVNSLTPGRTSVQPLRARLWSFLAVFATLALGFLWFARRGAPEWGALFFCLLAIQGELLDLTLQARGYGFLCLFALLASMLAISLTRDVTLRGLAGLAVVSVLGAWTVPTFVLFVGALWGVVLAVSSKRRSVFVAGLTAAAAIALAYAPIAEEVAASARTFQAQFPSEFTNAALLREGLARFLLYPVGVLRPWKIVLLMAGVLGVLGAVPRARREDRATTVGTLIALAAVGTFVGVCLALSTPPIRTAAFIVPPVLFGAVAILQLAAARLGGTVRVTLAFAAVILALRSGSIAANLRFVPWEAWKETAATIRELFPEGTGVFVTEKPEYLSAYLGPSYPLVSGCRPDDLARGDTVFVDASRELHGRRPGRTELGADAVEFRVRQRRADYQAIWLAPPARSFVCGVRAGARDLSSETTDRRVVSGIAPGPNPLVITLEPPSRYRALVLVSSPGPHGPRVTIRALHDGVVTTVSLAPGWAGGPVESLREVWATRPRP